MSHLLKWRSLTPFGVEIDLKLSADSPAPVIAELCTLYERHHLLVFRDQTLSFDAQKSVSGWFGPVVDGEAPTYISTDPDVGGLGMGELPFHSDLMCSEHPLLGISLHAVNVIDDATSTIFVNTMEAGRRLPEEMRQHLRRLHGVHLWPLLFSERPRQSTAPQDWPGAVHPLLMSHPGNGKLILCLNANHTDRIVELPPEDSELLIQTLFNHLYDDRHKYEHRWRKGDFVIWDNLALQHGRASIPKDMPRTLQKVTLGTHALRSLMPPSVLAAYQRIERMERPAS